jgi:hypothetical protein
MPLIIEISVDVPAPFPGNPKEYHLILLNLTRNGGAVGGMGGDAGGVGGDAGGVGGAVGGVGGAVGERYWTLQLGHWGIKGILLNLVRKYEDQGKNL